MADRAASRSWGWWALALALTSCSFNGAAPEGANIVCASDAQCPSGWRCQLTRNRCVQERAFDTTPPDVVAGSVRVTLIAPVGAILPTPTRLGAGGQAQLAFSTTEPLLDVPALTTAPELECDRPVGNDTLWSITCRVPAGQAPLKADVTAEVSLVDFALNTNVVPLSPFALRLDTVPPAAPQVSVPGQVTYRRAPWGAEETKGLPSWRVVGAPGAAEALALVVVRDGVRELGRGPAAADGSFDVDLIPADLGAVEVLAVDAAANASPQVKVHDATWIATLGGKIPGVTIDNPHRFEWVRVHRNAVVRADGIEQGVQALARQDGTALTVSGGGTAVQRTQLTPRGFSSPAAVYDPARGRVVRFGGGDFYRLQVLFLVIQEPTELNDTYRFTGEDWVLDRVLDPEGDGQPSTRQRAAMAFDSTRREALLFGGSNSGEVRDDLWAWNASSWRKLGDGPGPRPAARDDAAMFFSTRDGVAVVHGGRGTDGGTLGGPGSLVFGDTWLWDGFAWSAMPGPGPSPRSGSAVAWNPLEGEAWLFGGADGTDGGVLGDTWRWTRAGWNQVDAGAGPSPRRNGRMVWDTARDRGVLVGGANASGQAQGDTWEWNGAQWSLAAADGGFGGREAHALVYDASRNRTYLFGETQYVGANPRYPDGRVWSWDGVKWFPENVPGPVPRASFSLNPNLFDNGRVDLRLTAFNPFFFATVLGAHAWFERVLDTSTLPPWARQLELWTYSAFGWRQTGAPSNRLPNRYNSQTAAEDPVTHRVLFVGAGAPDELAQLVDPTGNGDTWEFATDGGWVRILDDRDGGLTGALASTIGQPALGFQRGVPVLASGVDKRKELMWFDSTGWHRGPSMATNLVFPTAISEPDGGLILVGSSIDDAGFSTLQMQAYQVQQLSTPLPDGGAAPFDGGVTAFASAPPLDVGMGAWNTQRGRPLVFGQFGSVYGPTAELREWDGATWRLVPMGDPEGDGLPSGRIGAGFSHDPVRNRTVLAHGGTLETAPFKMLDDTWEFLLSDQKPAGTFKVQLGAARLPPTALAKRVVARAFAGGTGFTSGAPRSGADLALWRVDRWVSAALPNAAPASAPQALELEVAQPEVLAQLLAAQPELDLALLPLGENGSDFAQLSVDYVELRLEYQVP